jgi:hypothetical protein
LLVKQSALTFISLVMFAALATGQEARRVPRGIREADKAEISFEKNVPPPQNIPRTNPQNLQRDADDLARLAQSIPTDIEQIHRGILPAGLKEKLKTIEKLSKRLRSGLAP